MRALSFSRRSALMASFSFSFSTSAAGALAMKPWLFSLPLARAISP